jgi:hypothetical protein
MRRKAAPASSQPFYEVRRLEMIETEWWFDIVDQHRNQRDATRL